MANSLISLLSWPGSYISARLARVTDSTLFIPEIDGLRFVAIFSVVWYHLLGIISVRRFGTWDPAIFQGIPFFQILVNGYFGVPLFFVISGFILAVPFAHQHLNGAPAKPLRSYYLRRLSRLGPPYAIWLCVLFAVNCARGDLGLADWPHLAASLLYVHNLVYSEMSVVSAVAWSLEVEVQFYCLAPLFCSVFRMKNPIMRRGFLLVAILIVGWGNAELIPESSDRWSGNAWQMSVVNYLGYFFAGLLLADLHVSSSKSGSNLMRKLVWDGVAVAAWMWAWFHVEAASTIQILLPVSVFLAYLGSLRGLLVSSLLRNKVIHTIGGICYTIYLWHQPVLMTWGRYGLPELWQNDWTLGANLTLQTIVATMILLPLCSLGFVFLEKPFMKPIWWKSSLFNGIR